MTDDEFADLAEALLGRARDGRDDPPVTDVRVTSLADFLLARITEDEAVARYLPIYEAPGQASIYVEGGVLVPVPDAARLLAECVAKREVVRLAGIASRGWTTTWPDAGNDPGADILRALAQPYADHPDYRPEWKA